jgi:hypothetical protein
MRDRFSLDSPRQGVMTMPKNDKYKDYARYAECCLNMVTATTDQESRRVQREMADEWLRLAGAIRRPRRYKHMQME